MSAGVAGRIETGVIMRRHCPNWLPRRASCPASAPDMRLPPFPRLAYPYAAAAVRPVPRLRRGSPIKLRLCPVTSTLPGTSPGQRALTRAPASGSIRAALPTHIFAVPGQHLRVDRLHRGGPAVVLDRQPRRGRARHLAAERLPVGDDALHQRGRPPLADALGHLRGSEEESHARAGPPFAAAPLVDVGRTDHA